MANTTFLGNVRENGDGLRTSIAGSMCATANFHIPNTLRAGDEMYKNQKQIQLQ